MRRGGRLAPDRAAGKVTPRPAPVLLPGGRRRREAVVATGTSARPLSVRRYGPGSRHPARGVPGWAASAPAWALLLPRGPRRRLRPERGAGLAATPPSPRCAPGRAHRARPSPSSPPAPRRDRWPDRGSRQPGPRGPAVSRSCRF